MNKNLSFRFVAVGLILALLAGGLVLDVGRTAAASGGETITRVLAQGSPLHGANGINFGPDGNLYIASWAGGYITVMDPDSGKILQRIYPEQGMDGPDDLMFGPDGSLYWTSLVPGKVGRMAPDGTQSLAAQLPPGVNPITFSEDGRLFVGLGFFGDGLYEVYLDGVTQPRLVRQGVAGINGFDFGPDGYLYAPIPGQHKIVRIDVDTGEMWDVVGGLNLPAAVKFDANGRLYVVDQPAGEVVRIDLASGERVVVAQLSPGLDNMAFDEEGRLFVSNADDGSVVEVLPNGSGRPVSPGGMMAPAGVAVLPGDDGQDEVYVADLWSLREFNGQTGQASSVYRGPMFGVNTVAPDGANLLVASWMGNAVYFVDPAGAVLEARTDFFVPVNAIRFQGDLVVSEIGTGSVVRSSSPGDRQVLATLALPLGLAATDDDLWVADWAMGTVFQLVRDGIPVVIPLASGLSSPEGLAIMADGSLLVVESGAGRVSRIDPATGAVTPLVDGLELGNPPISGAAVPPQWNFNGIAVGPTGAIYVTGDQTNVLYRIDLRP